MALHGRRKGNLVRWLVTGSAGMLGTDLVDLLRDRGEDVTASDREDLDITDPVAVDAAVPGHDVVVNCAAWTAVDDAEEREADAFRLNAVAAALGGLDVVADQLGQPTWTRDLADLVHRLVLAGAPTGIYHGTSSGITSWFDFAREVVGSAGLDPAIVRPTSSEAFVRPAPRPAYSALGHDALRAAGVAPIGDWAQRWAEAAQEVLGA